MPLNNTSFAKEERIDGIVKVITFIISPFISFVYSLRRMNTKSSFVVFFLFSVFFGMALSVADSVDSSLLYLDGVFYRMSFDQYCGSSYAAFLLDWKDYISFRGETKDFYFNLVAFIVSRFTHNYHVMFMVFAIVFAYFQLKCFRFFVENEKFKVALPLFILALIFTWNQIFSINGVRFNTAAWVFVYGLFQVFLKGNKRYIILIAAVPFIHASFFAYIAIFLIAFFFGKFERLWKILFIISFFVGSISVVLLRDITPYLPPVIQAMVGDYSSGEIVEQALFDFSSLSGLLLSLEKIFLSFLMIWVIFAKQDNDTKDIFSNKIYIAFIVFASFKNFFTAVPSLGGRMIAIVYPLFAYVWLDRFGSTKFKWMVYLIPFFMLITLRTRVWMYQMVLDSSFYYSNPFAIINDYLLQ